MHICGSDTIPYINECAMRKHACKEKQAKIGVKIGSDCNKYDLINLFDIHLFTTDRGHTISQKTINVSRLFTVKSLA